MDHQNVRQIYKFNNSGFCKLGEQCQNIHLTELCSRNITCKDKFCQRRHPRACSYCTQNGTYLHEPSELNMKLEKIEIKTLKKEIENIALALTGMSAKLDKVIKQNTTESNFKCELCGYNASSATVLKSHLTRNH